jgi:hypothetical protein
MVVMFFAVACETGIEQERTGATETGATAKFRAGQFQRVAQNPEQRRFWRNVHLPFAAVDVQSDGCHVCRSSGYGQTSYSTTGEKGNGNLRPNNTSNRHGDG